MKKYFLIIVLLCANVIFAADVIPVPIIIDNTEKREKKITPYSVQWLYDLYDQSPDYIVTEDVRKNILYFKHMMRSYVKKLSLNIEHQNRFVAKSAAKSTALLAGAAGTLGGAGWMFYQMSSKLYEKNKNLETVYVFGGMASTMVGSVLLILSTKELYDTITYKQWLADRYEVGKKILAQLEQIEEKAA